MESKEKLEHEAFKCLLKAYVLNNNSLNDFQKKQAMNNIDQAAKQADWIVEILKQCGYIK